MTGICEMLLVIQWIGIRQAMGGGKKEMRATEKQKDLKQWMP